jgi:L-amino acid N-acyltransferase YncA
MIRLAVRDDAAAVREIYAYYVTHTAVTFETEPPSQREMEHRIAVGGDAYPWLVDEWDGALVGFSSASRHHERAAYRWSVDCTVYVAAGFHGRGIGQGLYGILLRLLAAQGYGNAFAAVSLPNEPSVHLHERCGFRYLGTARNAGFKLGRWHDVSYWQRELNPCRNAPREPQSVLVAAAGIIAGAERRES